MTLAVADVRANLNENIRHAARIIGKSKDRLRVFEAIYRGKKRTKTVDDLIKATKLSHMRVLQEAGRLAGNGIVDQVRLNGRNAYKKDPTFTHHKKAIVDLCKNPARRSRYPTKQEPRSHGTTTVRIKVSASTPAPVQITIDEVTSFTIPNAASASAIALQKVSESKVKRFLLKVIGDKNKYGDWGGEKNDLYTTRLLYLGKRRTAAFALKGKATSGPLTPKKMGANGDQIGRLMASDADIYFVVYHSKIEESVTEQLRAYAVARTLTGRRTYYGVIDGQDLAMLVGRFPKAWKSA
jgi:hypothetical protein